MGQPYLFNCHWKSVKSGRDEKCGELGRDEKCGELGRDEKCGELGRDDKFNLL